MINLAPLKILFLGNNLQPIPKNLLNIKLQQDTFSSPLLTLINLITSIDISSYNFNQLQSYLQNLLNLIDLPEEEYHYALIILLIKATKTDFKYAQEIYNLYTSLTLIPDDSTYHQWLNYTLNINILPYLVYLKIDHKKLCNDIINCPAEIVNYT